MKKVQLKAASLIMVMALLSSCGLVNEIKHNKKRYTNHHKMVKINDPVPEQIVQETATPEAEPGDQIQTEVGEPSFDNGSNEITSYQPEKASSSAERKRERKEKKAGRIMAKVQDKVVDKIAGNNKRFREKNSGISGESGTERSDNNTLLVTVLIIVLILILLSLLGVGFLAEILYLLIVVLLIVLLLRLLGIV